MNEELNNRIQDWQDDNTNLGRNNVTQLNRSNSIVEGEFTFRLEKLLDLNVYETKIPIRVTRIFQTFAQNNENANSHGDIHRFDQLIENIERDFLDEISSAIDELLLQAEN